MQNIWFTSDTHFFHDRIMEFCPSTRRGKDSEEMTWLMVEAWNKTVKSGDLVYHLGDFSFKSKDHCKRVKEALNGQIHLIFGNHDGHIKKNADLQSLFASSHLLKNIKVKEHRFVLCHFPLAEWWDCHRGVIHIHGHLHGNKKNVGHQQKYKIFDAGIDTRCDDAMIPYHIDEVLDAVKDRELMNHH